MDKVKIRIVHEKIYGSSRRNCIAEPARAEQALDQAAGAGWTRRAMRTPYCSAGLPAASGHQTQSVVRGAEAGPQACNRSAHNIDRRRTSPPP